MFPLGILGLIQISVLPGYLWTRAALVKTKNNIEEGVYCFAASLILNHWLVYFLTATGLNRRPAWLAIALAEAILVFLLRHRDKAALDAVAQASPPLEGVAWAPWLWGSLALVNVAAFAFLLVQNWGTVFISNDDVASWDRWAQDWFLNRFPVGPGLYPQLLPANWSITYALMATPEVKMLAKAIMPAFGLATVLLFVSLARIRRDPAFLIGCSLCGYLLIQGLGQNFLMTGYADVALAFFSFLTFYTVYKEGPHPGKEARLLSLFFASGAALAKQGGLLVLVALLIYLAVEWQRSAVKDDSGWTPALRLSTLFSLAFLALWYVPRFYEAATRGSNLGLLLGDLHEGRGIFARIGFGCRLFIDALGTHGLIPFAVLAALTLGGLFCPPARKLTMYIVLPGFLIWGVSFSYEIRNAALLFPFIALVCGIVIGCAGSPLSRALGRFPSLLRGSPANYGIGCFLVAGGISLHYAAETASRSAVYAWPMILIGAASIVAGMVQVKAEVRARFSTPLVEIVLLVLLGLALWPRYPAAQLMTEQLSAQRLMGNPAVNQRLYALLDAGQLNQPVLSDYWYLASLPGMRSLIRTIACGQCAVPNLVEEIASNKDAGFLLVQGAFLPPKTTRSIEHCSGLEPVFAEGSVTLFRIDRMRFRNNCPLDLEAIRPVIEKLYPAMTMAGKGFNIQSNGSAAIAIACRNCSPSSVIVWAGTVLKSAYGGPNAVTGEVPARLYSAPGHYPIEIWDKDFSLRSVPADFEIK